MVGFCVSNLKKKCGFKIQNDQVYRQIQLGEMHIQQNTKNKFVDDKIFAGNDKIFLLIEGVVLNRKDLMQKYERDDFASAVERMYFQNGEDFFKEFRGPFSGFVFDVKKDKLIFYTSHYGDCPVFYYHKQGSFVVANDLYCITTLLKENGISISPDENTAYSVMTFGSSVNDQTMIKEIKRIENGHYISVGNRKLDIIRYFKLTNDVYNFNGWTYQQILKGLDDKFRNAVKLEFDKDIEYGYKHLCELSGGLDSRMNYLVAKSLGYKAVTCITFSNIHCNDELIAKQIVEDEHDLWRFCSINEYNTIDNYKQCVKLSYGLNLYLGGAGVLAACNSMNYGQFGVSHTGQIGDVVIGSFLLNENENKNKCITHTYSRNLLERIKFESIEKKFDNQELLLMDVRAFKVCLSSHIAKRNYIESVSPFLNVDLLEYCMSIPLKYRIGHKLYFDWIRNFYPNAKKYKWEKNNAKITNNRMIIFLRKKKNFVKKCFSYALRHFLHIKFKGAGMNPYDYWLENNLGSQASLRIAFESNINKIPISNLLKNDLIALFNGSVFEKSQAITVVESFSNFFQINGEVK